MNRRSDTKAPMSLDVFLFVARFRIGCTLMSPDSPSMFMSCCVNTLTPLGLLASAAKDIIQETSVKMAQVGSLGMWCFNSSSALMHKFMLTL